jgi:hypothetical protein
MNMNSIAAENLAVAYDENSDLRKGRHREIHNRIQRIGGNGAAVTRIGCDPKAVSMIKFQVSSKG